MKPSSFSGRGWTSLASGFRRRRRGEWQGALLLALAWLMVWPCASQAATLAGVVEDAASTEPLTGVAVVVKDVPRSVFRIATTDGIGHFVLSGIADGTYDFYLDSYMVDPPVQVTVSGQLDVTTIVLKGSPPPPAYEAPPDVLAERNPAVALDGSGNVHVVFERQGALTHSSWVSSAWTEVDEVTTGTAHYPALAYGSAINDGLTSEGLFCVWSTLDTTDTQTLDYAIGRFTPSGIEWSTTQSLTGDDFSDFAAQVLVRDGSEPLVVWSQRDLGTVDDTDAYYATVDLSGYTFTPKPSLYRPQAPVGSKPGLRESVEISVSFASGESVPSWVPVLGGKYDFDLGGSVAGEKECEGLSVSGGLSITIHVTKNFSANGSFEGVAEWKESPPDCDYVFASASVTGTVGGSGGLSSPPVPLIVGGVPLGSAVFSGGLSGSLSGTTTWSGSFPGWPDGGSYTITASPSVGAEIELLKGALSGSATVTGSATGVFSPPSAFKMTNVSVTVAGEACGFWGWWCESFTKTWTLHGARRGNYSFRDSGKDFTYFASSRGEEDYTITDELFATKNASFMGTGNVYEGTPILDDISADYYNDGPLSLAASAGGNITAAWAKEDGDYDSTLGSSVVARTFNGTTWGSVEEIADSTHFNRDVVIGYDSGDAAVAVWAQADGSSVSIDDPLDDLMAASEDSDIVVARKSGGNWGSPQGIATLSGPDTLPDLAAGEDGELLVAWINDNGSGVQSVRASFWNGSTWSSADSLTTSTLIDPPKAVYSADGPMVVWAQDTDDDPNTPNDWKVFSAVWLGSNWSLPESIIAVPAPEARSVASTRGERGRRGYIPLWDPAECDKLGPEFNAPGDMVIGPCSPEDPPGCRTVSYALPAVKDNCDGSPSIAGSPVSGSVLPFGTHTITLTAKDQWDNETVKTFSAQVLAVDLLYFTATASEVGQPIQLEWATASELDNAGFHVYRGTLVQSGVYLPGGRITASIIPAVGSATEGAVYRFTDTAPLQSDIEQRAYFLEDIDIHGVGNFHGPFFSNSLTSTDTTVQGWEEYD